MSLLAGCAKDDTYEKKDIQFRERSETSYEDSSLNIGLDYILSKDTYMYEDESLDRPFDTLEEGSLVRIIMDEGKDTVYIDFNGNLGFVKKDILVEP